jgi:hypothetical protein
MSWSGVRLSPLGTSATNWPIVPAPDARWWCMWSSRWNENWQGKPQYSEKTFPSATLSTTNPTWPDLGSNPGRRGGKPATNRLSYGTALKNPYWEAANSSAGPKILLLVMEPKDSLPQLYVYAIRIACHCHRCLIYLIQFRNQVMQHANLINKSFIPPNMFRLFQSSWGASTKFSTKIICTVHCLLHYHFQNA